MTSTARRMDQVDLGDASREVPILQVVFRGPEGVQGPVWPSEPRRSLVRRFWQTFHGEVGPGAALSYAPSVLPADAIRDAHGTLLPGTETLRGEVALFFIDPRPRANWSHPCVYVVMPGQGSPLRIEHGWPPADELTLTPLPRATVSR